jgi:hypothetical protein
MTGWKPSREHLGPDGGEDGPAQIARLADLAHLMLPVSGQIVTK